MGSLFLCLTLYAQPLEFHDARDGNIYPYVAIGPLDWFTENLRFTTALSLQVEDSSAENRQSCGEFYLVEEAATACPTGWRLPTEAEVKTLIKLQKKRKINLLDSLRIQLCGRIDGGQGGEMGEQNTFWIDATLSEGSITHWHTFGEEHHLHYHNVVQAKRQFPIRCVREAVE
jgi:hypothetical protein